MQRYHLLLLVVVLCLLVSLFAGDSTFYVILESVRSLYPEALISASLPIAG